MSIRINHARACYLAISCLSLATLLSACAVPSRPLWWPKPKHHSANPAIVARRQTKKIEVLTVAQPWHEGMRQLGIQVYWTDDAGYDLAQVQLRSRQIINYAVGLDANSIAVSFPFYTYGIYSSAVYAAKAATPTPAEIAIFLSEANESHIRVTLRPLLNENVLVAQNPIAWRGTISPQSRAAWFQSYQQLLLPYARVAQAGHAASFTIGTELDSLEGDPGWSGLVTALQSVYSGQLTYDENFNEFAEHNTNLPLAAFGVDAYPRFDLPDTASVGELTSSWIGWLGTHTPAVLQRAILSEVGIDAVAGSYSDPGAWLTTTKSAIDLPVQTKWYQAVCQAFTADNIGGIYWWEINFDANPDIPSSAASDRLTFLGRPAEQVIRGCFAQLAG